MSHRKFRIELNGVTDRAGFVEAVNRGLVQPVGGHWHGRGWDALHDFLSWPQEASYALELAGWAGCTALEAGERDRFEAILRSNPHVIVVRC